MDRSEVLRRRVAAQHVAGPGLGSATEVVRLLACVQSQEHAHGLWSLALRADGQTMAEVRAEFDAGSFLRTHILRPTWHYVAPEDLVWIQAVTAPRVHQLNATTFRQLGLDQRHVVQKAETITTELAGGNYLTRAELRRLIDAQGVALAYYVMYAELEGLICSGPMRGAQQTYALVSERIRHHNAGSLAELARRYIAGHGPTSARDLARWASLTQTQANEAVEEISADLASIEVEGSVLWFDPQSPGPATGGRAALLPLYDELTLSYPQLNFPRADEHPHVLGTDLFIGSVVVDEVNVGLWRRTLSAKKVVLELALAPSVTPHQHVAIRAEAERLGEFLGRNVELEVSAGPSAKPGR